MQIRQNSYCSWANLTGTQRFGECIECFDGQQKKLWSENCIGRSRCWRLFAAPFRDCIEPGDAFYTKTDAWCDGLDGLDTCLIQTDAMLELAWSSQPATSHMQPQQPQGEKVKLLPLTQFDTTSVLNSLMPKRHSLSVCVRAQ